MNRKRFEDVYDDEGDDDLQTAPPPNKSRVFGDAPPPQSVVVVAPANALLPQSDGAMTYKRFVMRPTALSIPDNVTQEEWVDFGFILKQLDTTISWVVGEWAEYANKNWAYTYEQIAEHFGYEISTLMSYTSIVRKIPTLIRNQGLSFAHHRLVANLPESQQQMWLTYAADMRWNVAQMKDAMHPKRQQDTSSITAQKARKKVRIFTAEIEGIIKELDENERLEIAQMLGKLAKKLSR